MAPEQDSDSEKQLVEMMAKAMYEDWFAPVRITWGMQDGVMRDKHRSEARAALRALTSAGYTITREDTA